MQETYSGLWENESDQACQISAGTHVAIRACNLDLSLLSVAQDQQNKYSYEHFKRWFVDTEWQRLYIWLKILEGI